MSSIEVEDANELFQAQAHLYKHVLSYMSSIFLKCAVELGIPDIIHKRGRPVTLPELVSALEFQPNKRNCLRRIMRLLDHSGFFSTTKVHNSREEENEAYALTSASKLLLKDKPYCLSPFVLLVTDAAFITPGHYLSRWLRGNELPDPFVTGHGINIWGYAEQNHEFNNLFNQGLASDSQMAKLIIKDCKHIFDGLSSLVEVGGGTGSFARIISEAFPSIKCSVLELPHVIADLPETDNLKFIAGDMNQSIPSADAFLFKLIFHDYDDEVCLKLLKNCREAVASSDGREKVIIVDIVVNEKKDKPEITEAKLLYDALMMTCVPGIERSEKEWERLFFDAGFTSYKITPLLGLRSFIEVYL
ncbi:hypothetical protein CISIN_1g043623mg [Citrus sinensis]|uniref:O-methyltransferase domain-containing protein n=1 Tax=Citrus sinensis TaxID=2711 RepID=A0A067DJT4_CITSI|nr:hypothetical protein CISIN_1g043623mg [Citrus sinensis]